MQIPEQVIGKKTDNTADITLQDEMSAKKHFEIVVRRLMDISHWRETAGPQSAAFQLCNESGEPVERSPKTGDYIGINIPAPGSTTGDGLDWVTIIDLSNEEKAHNHVVSITVRPADNPLKPNEDTAHFFSSAATSTFVAQRQGNRIEASVHGRNEEPNKETEDKVDKIRNRIVAAGAGVFSNIQWRSLVNGLISTD